MRKTIYYHKYYFLYNQTEQMNSFEKIASWMKYNDGVSDNGTSDDDEDLYLFNKENISSEMKIEKWLKYNEQWRKEIEAWKQENMKNEIFTDIQLGSDPATYLWRWLKQIIVTLTKPERLTLVSTIQKKAESNGTQKWKSIHFGLEWILKNELGNLL